MDRATGDPVDRSPLTSKTNVWGVGMIIHCLVTLDRRPRQSDWLGNPALDVPDSKKNQATRSSDPLHFLLQRCLEYDPTMRWTFREIIQTTNTYIQESGLDLAQGMRVASVGPYDQAREDNLPMLPHDVYALGLSQDDLPVLPF